MKDPEYMDNLSGTEGIALMKPQKDVTPNYAYFPIVVDEKKFGANRQVIVDRLAKEDIHVRKYFYPLTSDMDCYKGRFDSSLTPVANGLPTGRSHFR